MAGPETQTPDARTRLVESLWNDDEARGELAALIEKHAPGTHQRAAIRQTLTGVEKAKADLEAERAAIRKEREEERQRTTVDGARRSLIQSGLASEAEIPEIEKLMREKYIGDYPSAAQLYRHSQQTAAPRTYANPSADVPGLGGAGGEDFKGIIEDAKANGGIPVNWRRKTYTTILNDYARDPAGAQRRWG